MDIELIGTDIKITLDDYWQPVQPKPDDPKNLSIIGINTPEAYSLVFIQPIAESELIPIGNKIVLINGIRKYLNENNGFIEVDTNIEKNPYSYSIIKTLLESHGIQYGINFHVKVNNLCFQIQGFFEENGTTGTREAQIYEYCRRENVIKIEEKNGKINIIGWNEDPYDKNYTKGQLMNIAEKENVDEYFPHHPLSEARKLIKKIIEYINK
jgi:hypothetical protein